MGQCFGTDCAGLCPRWSYRQERGFDRYTKFAPKNRSRKYGDQHLLSEIQDPRSDDEIDFSDIHSEISGQRTNDDRKPYSDTSSPVTAERTNKGVYNGPKSDSHQPSTPQYTAINIE
ncbi:uncharacterized protein LOC116289494 [Actinia tenebrosa]|uniref:Uncharacterized protein LOC116289494 n=1 Tax=Actinia tenebrosa TaxID=6105 RepID=A0A6P8HI46_ACTTE|nr:uncharacterized protein LOC116289494 [Actinia tenebrosa]